jgi:outer membrane protein insertion porin family
VCLRIAFYVCIVLIAAVPYLVGQSQQDEVPSDEPARTAPQVSRVLPSYEGRNVSSVEIAGRPDVDFHELKHLLQQQPGQPFSKAKIDASIAALKTTGRFEDVQVQVVPELEGIRVLLVLQPGLYFGMYTFPGAVRGPSSYTRLLQVSSYPPEGPYSERDVNSASEALTKYFQRTGFFQAEVKPEIQPDPNHGLVNVAFHTKLGKRAKFGEVQIEGTTPEMKQILTSKLKSLMARVKGSAIRPGKNYSLRTIQNASRRLENTLMSEDRLSAVVKLAGANYDPKTNRADVIFNVTPGPVTHVRTEGARLWSWTRRKLLPVYQQVGTDPEIVQEGRRNLISHFQSKGFFDVRVNVNEKDASDGKTILYTIEKGPRRKVEEVTITGNQSVPTQELASRVSVREKGWSFLSRGSFSEKLLRDSVKNLESVYHAAGFSTVQVTPQVTNKQENIAVTFRVVEGPRDIVGTLRIVGNNTMPVAQLAPKGLKVVEGMPYSQKLVDEDRTQIVSEYLNQGYLTATFRQTVKALQEDKHRLVVSYEIYEGPRVTANSVITIGRNETRQTFIDKVAELEAGRPIRQSELLSSASRLYEPGIFDWAEVDPRRQITTQTEEDVVVKVHEARKNSLTYGFGFEVINRGGSVPGGTVAVPGVPPIGVSDEFRTSEKTFWGPRGNIEYTRRNVRGRGETISLGGLAGRLIQRGDFSYQVPHLRNTSWASNLTFAGEHNSTNPIYSSRFGETGLQFQRTLDKDKTQNLYLRYAFRDTSITRLLIEELVPEEDRDVRLSTIAGSYTRDTRDNSLDAHKGIYESFELGITPVALGSSVNFARFIGQTAYYRTLPAKIVWANSIRIGFLKAFAESHVPISEQFFTGGGSTLRGFPLNGAGQQRTITVCNEDDPTVCAPISVPTGGNQLLIVNSEFRIPMPIKKGLGVVGFYDGGNVFRTIGLHGQYTNTFGFGIRYATPVGPVRIDVGHNLNAPPGIKSTQYFITLGQAF